jgi:hypothetical protein
MATDGTVARMDARSYVAVAFLIRSFGRATAESLDRHALGPIRGYGETPQELAPGEKL